ncbi:MAG: hypothetical protein J6A03_09930 [Lachnospiraceae bacterium]|nr:hypothetical protein [Lachnospiraceae bacterium]
MLEIIAGAVGTIVSGALAITKALSIASLTIQGLKLLGNAIAMIAKALGIIKPERDVEEVGDRALQAEEKGIKPENYASYEEWVKKIERDDWGFDPEKNKDMDPKEKVLKGIEVASAVTIEKFPDLPIEDFIKMSVTKNDFLTEDRMLEVSKLAKDDHDGFAKIVGYVTGETKDRTSLNEAEDMLMDIEKTITPGLDDDAAYDRVARFYTNKQ